jgi:hypothetical protein
MSSLTKNELYSREHDHAGYAAAADFMGSIAGGTTETEPQLRKHPLQK